MTAARPWLLLLSLAALATVAGCGGGGGASPFVGPVSSGSATTTVPVPSATSASVSVPVPGGTPIAVTIPVVSGAPAGSTIAISASTTRPTALPSAVPQSPIYVTVALPAGASMSSPPSLAAPSGTATFGFGPVSFSTQMTTLARTRSAAAAASASAASDVTVIYDPTAPQVVGMTYNGSQILGQRFAGDGLVPYQYSVVPGGSATLFLDGIGPNEPFATAFAAAVPSTVASNVTFAKSSAACTGYEQAACTSFSLGVNAQYGANPASFPIVVLDQNSGYGGVATVFIAAAKTTTLSFGDFNEFPAFSAQAPVPLLATAFTSADLSLPAVSPASSSLPLTITTSVTPLDTNLNFAIESLHIGSHVAAVNFSFPQTLVFGAPGNLSSDFCFASQTLVPAYAVFSYVGTTYKQLQTTVASADATCPTGIHLSVPSDFGTSPIPASTNFGLVIITKTSYTNAFIRSKR